MRGRSGRQSGCEEKACDEVCLRLSPAPRNGAGWQDGRFAAPVTAQTCMAGWLLGPTTRSILTASNETSNNVRPHSEANTATWPCELPHVA